MESKKIIKNITLGLVCLSVLVLIGLSIYQHILLKNLSQIENQETISREETTGNAPPQSDITTRQYSGEKTSSPAVQEKQPDTGDIDALEDQLEATEQELDAAYQQLTDEAAKKEELKKTEVELQKKMIEDPSYKKSLKISLESQYEFLFSELDLSPEDREKFMDLTTDFYYKSYIQLIPESQSASSDEQKAELQKLFEDAWNEYDDNLKEFLGEDGFNKSLVYGPSVMSNINGFMESLDSDDNLTIDQQRSLAQIWYKEMTDRFSEMGYDPRRRLESSADINEKTTAERLKSLEIIHSRTIEGAVGTLSESQIEQFNSYLKNQREMLEMALKLSE